VSEKIDISDPNLRIEIFRNEKLPDYFQFDALDQELVDFYNEDAEKCQKESISLVKNVFYKEKLIAYFAYTSSEIKCDHLSMNDQIINFAHPALKLGRLLVCKSMRGKGIGSIILQEIARTALDLKNKIPLRFIIVDSLPNAVDFYKKQGFIDSGIKRGKQRDLSLLYIDLSHIE
jgi:GNAT superfamily N-acetyltransferase